MKNLKAALAGVGLTFSDVAKTNVLLTDMGFFAKFNAIYAEYFEKDRYPARVCYAVKGLPKDSLVEIDAIAYKGENSESIKKKVHESE
jgi:2-iminobutanoate/2-iminopropanoate deaminase